MIYNGFILRSDNSHYKNGVHAAKVFKCGLTWWFDSFTAAIGFIRCFQLLTQTKFISYEHNRFYKRVRKPDFETQTKEIGFI